MDSKKVRKYDFSTGKYTLLTTLDKGRAGHGCTAYELDGTRYLVVVGGHDDKNIATDNVIQYNFDSNEWESFKPYPFPIVRPTVLVQQVKGNFGKKQIYVFGGYYDYYSYKVSDIYFMSPNKNTNNWKHLGAMSRTGAQPLVVPYTNKIIMK